MGQTQNRMKSPNFSQHPRLGSYQLKCRAQNQQQSLIKQVYLSSRKAMEEWYNNLTRYQPHPPKLFLPLQFTYANNPFCGHQCSAVVKFDHFPFTLQKEIEYRHGLGCQFSQAEIWFLLYELCLSCSHFQAWNQKSGDVRPRNVLINSTGDIRLFNRYSLPQELTNYQKSLQNNEPTYLAPEEMEDLGQGRLCSSGNPCVAETFSIAITVLDAAMMQNGSTLYNMRSPMLRKKQLRDMIESWTISNRSRFLKQTICNMLQLSNQQRPTPGQIWAMLLPYQKQIRSLQQFQPNKLSSKQSLQKYQSNRHNTAKRLNLSCRS